MPGCSPYLKRILGETALSFLGLGLRPPITSWGILLIEARNVTRILRETVPVTLVKDVSLAIGEKEFIAITGPSGSGKSSLLYLLGLLDRPTEGEIHVSGRDTMQMEEEERARTRLALIGFFALFRHQG